MSQILTKPSLLSSEYQITVPDEIWAEKLNFPYPKAIFFKYP